MRHVRFFVVVILGVVGPALAGPTRLNPNSFSTTAKFFVDDTRMSLSTGVATVESRRGAPGYSWLRITFYSFPLTAEDVAGAVNGNLESMEKRWNQTANHPNEYNVSHAVIQLTVDKDFKVWQVDMSVPGHGCTIAPAEPDVKKFLQDYQFDGKKLRLKSKGSYVCDMKFIGIPNQKFGWDMDLNLPVFRKLTSRK